MFEVVISLFLRFSGAIAKLILMLYLAKFSDPETLGQFGVIVAIIAIASQVVGLDVHYFNSRIISSEEKNLVSKTIMSQLFLHLLTYIVLIPILVILFLFDFIELKSLMYLFFLIIFEHLSIEASRFLQFILRPNLGAVVLFIRNTLFVIIFIVASFLNQAYLSIDFLMESWLFSIVIAFAFGIYFIKDYIFIDDAKIFMHKSYYYELIKKSFPFLVASIFFLLTQYLDRLILNVFEGDYLVGILFFFASIASALHLFVTYTVGVFHGPIAIKRFRNEGLDGYSSEKFLMVKKSIIATLVALLLCIILINPLLTLINQDYIPYLNVFYIFLVVQVFAVVSDFFQLDLYVRGMDKEIMYSSLAGGVSTFILQIILVKLFSIYGAAFATLLGIMLLTIFRYIFYKRALKKDPDLLFKINKAS